MAAEIIFPVKKLIRITDDQEKRIADFRFSQRLQSETEAIRRLIELGLEAAKRGQEESA
jgi:hypothetical protein